MTKHKITLLTCDQNKGDIEKFYAGAIPTNLDIVAFSDDYYLRANNFFHKHLKVGYFLFNQKIEKFLNKNKSYIDNADMLFHRSPQSFRYFSALSKYDKPFIFGPIEGGLKPAPELKNYFAKEPSLFKMRNLDKWILRRNRYRVQFDKAKKILISLDYILDILDKRYHSKTIQIFNTGIDCSAWMPNRVAEQNTGTIEVLYVGTLTRYKGCELVIRAFADETVKKDNLKLHILGRGEEEEYLKKLAKELNMQDKIMFHGFLPKEQIKGFYDKSHIFCFPTLKEAAGNVLLEAMSCGLPIITVDTGGPKYMCPQDGCFKLPIKPVDEMVRSIANAVHLLANDAAMRNKMGQFNHKHCVDNYENKVLNVFDDLL